MSGSKSKALVVKNCGVGSNCRIVGKCSKQDRQGRISSAGGPSAPSRSQLGDVVDAGRCVIALIVSSAALTAANSSSGAISAGLALSSSQQIASPLSCVLGGKMVCMPVERNSTIMPDDLLLYFFVVTGAVTRYKRCDRDLPRRPNTNGVGGR